MWVLILEGLAIGGLLGLTGAGGGILAVPATDGESGLDRGTGCACGLAGSVSVCLGRNVRGFIQAYCTLSRCALDRPDQYSFSTLWRKSGWYCFSGLADDGFQSSHVDCGLPDLL